MTEKQKKTRSRIILTAAIFVILMVLEHTVLQGFFESNRIPATIIFLVPYLIVGYDVLMKAFTNIGHGQVFDEHFLMMIATVGAFVVGEYSEAVAVMLFYQVGELFQSYAVGKSRESIADLMEINPEYANVETDGKLEQVDPDDVEPGTVITVLPGEKIPIDGVVVEGSSMVDTSALTGESVPRSVSEGSEVVSGCVNGEGLLKVRTTKAFEDSTVTRILELVEDASSRKANVENFITRFARCYTPVVTICAVLLAVIPPLFMRGDWSDWLMRACVFLVISCPCALVISVPMGFFGGIGASSRNGILVKGSNYLEALSEVDTVVFDKTGTLTKGEFKVLKVIPEDGFSEDEVMEVAALAEGYSTHPIADALKKARGREPDMDRVTEEKTVPGRGIDATIDGKTVLAGNRALMEENGIAGLVRCPEGLTGTLVFVAIEGKPAGVIEVGDEIKEGVKEALSNIKKEGAARLVMLTGDREDTAAAVAGSIGVTEHRAELLPQDKVRAVEELIDGLADKEKLAFVGDGINDAPVLTRSDVGIAMGSMGSDAAIEAADVVIMDDDIGRIPLAMRIAGKTMRIVKANIVFALAVKFLVLALGALGIANMWAAVFADVGVAILCILNSMRTLAKS